MSDLNEVTEAMNARYMAKRLGLPQPGLFLTEDEVIHDVKARFDAKDARIAELEAECERLRAVVEPSDEPTKDDIGGRLEHIGWLPAVWNPTDTGIFVHRHWFDEWDDELIRFHVNCRPVFASDTARCDDPQSRLDEAEAALAAPPDQPKEPSE